MSTPLFVEKLSDYVFNSEAIPNINNYDINGNDFYDKASLIRIDKDFFHHAVQKGVEFEAWDIPWLKKEVPTLNEIFHMMLDSRSEPFTQKEMIDFVMALPSVESHRPLKDIFTDAIKSGHWKLRNNDTFVTMNHVYAKLVYGLLCGFTREVSTFFIIRDKVKELFGDSVEVFSNRVLDGEYITDILLREKNKQWAICIRIFCEDRKYKMNADRKLEKRGLKKRFVTVSDKYKFDTLPYRVLQNKNGFKTVVDSRLLFVDVNAEFPKDHDAIAMVSKEAILPTMRLIYCFLNNKEKIQDLRFRCSQA